MKKSLASLLILLLFSLPSLAQVENEDEREMWMSTLQCTSSGKTMLWKEGKSSFLHLSPQLLIDTGSQSDGKIFLISMHKKTGELFLLKGEDFEHIDFKLTLDLDGPKSILKINALPERTLDCHRLAPPKPAMKIIY